MATAIHWTGGGTKALPQSGNWSATSSWFGGVVPVSGDNVDLGGGPSSSAYTVTLDVNSANLNNLTFDSSGGKPTLDVSSNTLTVEHNLTLGHGAITIVGGTIDAWNVKLSQSNGSIIGSGTLSAGNAITGSGLIEASGGALEVQGRVGSGVQLEVAVGADLALEGGKVAASSTMTFQDALASTTLDLTGEGRGPNGEIADFKATVAGFGTDDQILVAGAAGDTVSYDTSTGVLSVEDNAVTPHTAETIQLTGTYDPTGFHIAAGTTDSITYSVAAICFMAGTLVRTPNGEVAVETLKRGDLVVASDGRAVPVTWLGRQTISTRFSDPLRVLPIRIKAGALGDNVPSRDLLLSPDHAVLVDGALMHAGALVNRTSIVRETDVPEVFTYYHVEADDHVLILAENTPAETFVDNIDRLNFDNWAEHQALYPEGKSITELPYPRAKSLRQVPVCIRVKLAEHAQTIGAAVGGVAVA